MSLNQAKLKTEIMKLIDEETPGFIGFPTDLVTACQNWGNAYNIYALDAVDISGDKLLTSNLVGFQNALAANLPVAEAGTSILAASAFDLAFISYWTAAVFSIGMIPLGGIGGTGIFSVEISSVVSAITPNVLNNLLLPIFNLNSEDTDAKADSLATAFHTATTTAIFCLISGLDTSPPPGGPLPIINISTIN